MASQTITQADVTSPIPGISRNVFLLGIVSLLNDISSEMLYPLIPLFLTATLGAPVAAVGLVEGAAEMTSAIMKGFSGWWSDRIGRRMPFVIGGYALSGIAKPMLALVYSWPLVLVARVLDRFGKGTRTTARDALIAESCSPATRGRAFGFHRSADQIGAVVGPLLALPLLAAFHQNYRAIFLLAFVPAVLSVVCLFAVKETGNAGSGAAAPPALRWSSTPKLFRRFLLITALFGIGNSSDVFLILRARQLGLSDTAVFETYALFNLFTVLASYPAGIMSDRFGRKRILVAGFLLFAITYVGFGIATAPVWIWGLYCIYGLYSGVAEGVSRAYAVDLAGPENRGSALGLHSLATGLTTLAASSIAGLLWSHVSPGAPFLFGAALATAAAAGLALLL